MNNEFAVLIQEQLKHFVKEIISKELKKQSNKPQSESPYMNKKETCAYIKKSNNTLDKLIKDDRFPIIKKGNSLFFDRREIDIWMKEK